MSKVTLAYPYTDKAGKSHKPDTTVDLPEQEAHNLLASGRARKGEKPAPEKSADPAAPKSGTTTKEK